ncbi:MAG: hypothetical protein A2W61_06305 [Deltaproteobacteria bacterium RIFCSPLOWO2_01_44_7]|nr:MAG: hypothetical protein A2712_02805 [Deltaproteobacteria bacterium RIFCSPHIGHO2_01_FULL_43_49]OGQ16125.1 MAG: hypothetical protein A3D22_00775 [Deltaproteobacteria bacterium RIFCSPHIGHO2_02_FULL_44_53]OGQ29086.1 MAG: hypothetical protein A3D98_04560 [Deltaproteobacteria bacterium RIFCSPHIGHO2_12_FULL_44_21]OGQ32642.1 MAG: hypothetical protein A2979_08705 [Deltaproteobacteria bacterium RIFCSPLOWO2_01_FULL_45_74]OGQ38028.1 MAG: hypothetical protein A2W61_06305 [Deltaproteobacteria bacterium 
MKNFIKNQLKTVFKKVLPSYVTFDQNRNDRSGALHKAWGHIISNNIRGAYYEFGVYKGDSLYESLRIYNEYLNWIRNQKKSQELWRRKVDWFVGHQFYAFDTFEGMPANEEEHHAFKRGYFLAGIEEVQARLAPLPGSEKIGYFQGTFKQVAKQFVCVGGCAVAKNLDKVAIANVDCDLYSSTVDALRILEGKLQQGSVLLFDDWYQFNADNNQGQRRGVKEFLNKNKQIILEEYITYSHCGKAFIVQMEDK